MTAGTGGSGGGRRGEHFWNSMAGMITAVAGLITALVGVAAFLVAQHSGGGAGAAPNPDRTTVASLAPVGPSPADTGVSAGGAPVAWRAEALLDNDGLELDGAGPVHGSGGQVGDLATTTESSVTAIGARVAPWNRSVEPTRDGCAAALQAFGTDEVPVDVGTRFCVRSSAGRIGTVRILERTGDASLLGWQVAVTMWTGS